MKPLPVKAIRRLMQEFGDQLDAMPEMEGDFIYRGKVTINKDGQVGMTAEAESNLPTEPVAGSLGVGVRSSWDNVGDNEIVIRLHGPSRAP